MGLRVTREDHAPDGGPAADGAQGAHERDGGRVEQGSSGGGFPGARTWPVNRGTRWAGLLIAVAVAFAVLQVTVLDVTRFWAFDEAVYVAEVQPGVDRVSFAAHRARGITWVIAPVTALGGEVVAVRLWLVALSSVGLWLAFRTWIPTLGWLAPLAAAVMASMWVSLFYGSEVFPNFISALAAVAAVGLFVAGPNGREWVTRWGIAGALFVTALVRPTESIWLGLGLAVVAVMAGRREAIGRLAAGAVGAFAGWVPWLVEAAARFGGPVERFNRIRETTVDPGDGTQLLSYLAMSGGPTAGPVSPETVSPWAMTAAVGLLVVIMAGALRPPSWLDRIAVRAAAVCGALLLIPYLTLNAQIYPRFLLPAWALASIPAAVGLATIVRGRGTARGLPLAVVAALLCAWTGFHLVTAHRVGAEVAEERRVVHHLGQTLSRETDRPCAVASSLGHPQIAMLSRCQAAKLYPHVDDSLRQLDADGLADQGIAVYAFAGQELAPGSPLHDWQQEPVPGLPSWTLYRHPANDTQADR